MGYKDNVILESYYSRIVDVISGYATFDVFLNATYVYTYVFVKYVMCYL